MGIRLVRRMLRRDLAMLTCDSCVIVLRKLPKNTLISTLRMLSSYRISPRLRMMTQLMASRIIFRRISNWHCTQNTRRSICKPRKKAKTSICKSSVSKRNCKTKLVWKRRYCPILTDRNYHRVHKSPSLNSPLILSLNPQKRFKKMSLGAMTWMTVAIWVISEKILQLKKSKESSN